MTMKSVASSLQHTSSLSSSTAASSSTHGTERYMPLFRQFRSASFVALTALAALIQLSGKLLVVGRATYLIVIPFFFSLAISLASFLIASFNLISCEDTCEAPCDALGAMTQRCCLL
jgi:hypothetical protein